MSHAPNHLADLRKSGLSDEQISTCGFRTIRDSREVANVLRWSRADKLGPCLLLPYRRPDGSLIPANEFARIKPDTPRTNSKPGISSGKLVKYESPKGSTLKLYFPPRTCGLLADVSLPLLLTEGEKKSAKADQEGFVCIGLGGVDAWSKKREKGPDGKKIGQRELIDDFDAVALAVDQQCNHPALRFARPDHPRLPGHTQALPSTSPAKRANCRQSPPPAVKTGDYPWPITSSSSSKSSAAAPASR